MGDRLPDTIEVLVVGGGQAGIAMSEHLGTRGIPHLVLERDRVAERWRSGRWDSLVANGPVWHDRFPGLAFDDVDQDVFAGKERVADYFVEYAERIGAPIHTGVEVTSVRRHGDRRGWQGIPADLYQCRIALRRCPEGHDQWLDRCAVNER